MLFYSAIFVLILNDEMRFYLNPFFYIKYRGLLMKLYNFPNIKW